MAMEVKSAALVLSDISGYTDFVRYHAMAVLHAEQIITDLLEAVIDQAEYPLSVSKIEGDAVFFYAASQGDDLALARDVAKQALMFFEAFKAKLSMLMSNPICLCDACRNVEELKLKVFLHHGNVAFKKVKQFEELAGEAVILAHRLMKNTLNAREYILMTETFHQLSGGLPGLEPERHVQEYEGIGRVPALVYYPDGKEGAPVAASQVPFMARLRQYLRVNGHAVLRFLGLRSRRPFLHLPDNAPR